MDVKAPWTPNGTADLDTATNRKQKNSLDKFVLERAYEPAGLWSKFQVTFVFRGIIYDITKNCSSPGHFLHRPC
jgi:hypothetical protein